MRVCTLYALCRSAHSKACSALSWSSISSEIAPIRSHTCSLAALRRVESWLCACATAAAAAACVQGRASQSSAHDASTTPHTGMSRRGSRGAPHKEAGRPELPREGGRRAGK
jgi:hypothetical protein